MCICRTIIVICLLLATPALSGDVPDATVGPTITMPLTNGTKASVDPRACTVNSCSRCTTCSCSWKYWTNWTPDPDAISDMGYLGQSSVSTLRACGSRCCRKTNCASFTYNKVSKLCVLYRMTNFDGQIEDLLVSGPGLYTGFMTVRNGFDVFDEDIYDY